MQQERRRGGCGVRVPHDQVGVELRVDLEHGAVLAVIRRPPRVERDQLVVEAGVVVRAQVQVGHGSAWLGLIDHRRAGADERVSEWRGGRSV